MGSSCFDEPLDECSDNSNDYEDPVSLQNEVKPSQFEVVDLLQVDLKTEPDAVKEEPFDDNSYEVRNQYTNSAQSSKTLRKPDRPLPYSASEDEYHNSTHKSHRDKSKIEREDKQIRDFFRMSCDMCELTFQTMREALRHYRDTHDQAGYLICCEKKFFRRCLALDHIRMHVNPNFLQ